MHFYSFAPGYPKASLERLTEAVDAYLDLRGEKTTVLAVSSGWATYVTQTTPVSTCIKILKILSYLILPIVLLALALHYFLHACLEYSYKLVSLNARLSPKDKTILITNSSSVKKAAEEAPATFFEVEPEWRRVILTTSDTGETRVTFFDLKGFLSANPELVLQAMDAAPSAFSVIPPEYRKATLTLSQEKPPHLCFDIDLKSFLEANAGTLEKASREGLKAARPSYSVVPKEYQKTTLILSKKKPPKLVFDVDLEKITEKLNISNINLPREKLQPGHDCEPEILKEIEKLLLEKQETVSDQGKKQLLRHFLKYLFSTGITKESSEERARKTEPWKTIFPFLKENLAVPPCAKNRDLPSVWSLLFFSPLEGSPEGFGGEILRQLKLLGCLYSKRGIENPLKTPYDVRVFWD